MTRIVYWLTLVLAIACTSCSSSQDKAQSATTTTYTGTASQPDTIIQHYVQYLRETDTDTEDTVNYVAREITPADLGINKTIHGRPFDPAISLKALFPGSYMYVADPGKNNDSILLSAWACKNCAQDKLSGWYGEDSEAFPFTNGNITRVADTAMFVDEAGRPNVIVSFASVHLQDPEFMFSGRFICAVLGLARYTYEHGQWMLKTFAPRLGCYGAFQTLPDMHLVKTGKNTFGCYFLNTNGGAGGPFYSDLYIYGIVDDHFSLILAETGVRRSKLEKTGWDIRMDVAPTINGFADIRVMLSGTYDKKSFADGHDDESNMPAEVHAAMKTKSSFRFKINRVYKYQGSSYRQFDSKVDIQ